jgi:hypothetical protein
MVYCISVKQLKVNLISGTIKEATPAWVRALAGGGLSSASLKKLIQTLPENKTRLLKSINNKPKLLGAGGEGRVYESFTGGHGPSAIKLISTRPSAANEKRIDSIKNLFSSSDIFPQVLSTIRGGRGYAIPRLQPLPPTSNSLKELMSLPSSNKKQWLDFVNRFQKSTLEPERVSIPDAKRFGNYNAGGLPNTALMQTAKGPVDVSDIKGSGNIMFNQTGRPYLVDPWIHNI